MNRPQRRTQAARLASQETAVTYRLAGLLLEYPTPELLDLLPTIRAAADGLAPRARTSLLGVADHLGGRGVADLQAAYVDTFDLRRRHALYLTYFAYGDTRKRGVALVSLKQTYRRAGFEIARDELPDHLGVVLEFASSGGTVTWAAGIELLLEHRAGLELLRLALLDGGSPWSGALTAVSGTLPTLGKDERTAVADLAAAGPPGEDVGLDAYPPPSFLADAGAYGAILAGARR